MNSPSASVEIPQLTRTTAATGGPPADGVLCRAACSPLSSHDITGIGGTAVPPPARPRPAPEIGPSIGAHATPAPSPVAVTPPLCVSC